MIAILCSFAIAAAAQALPDSSKDTGWPDWYFTDRIFKDLDGRYPLPEEKSQDYLAALATCCGFSDPGVQEKVITIDGPREAPLIHYAIALPETLTLRELEICPEVKSTPGSRTYISVLRLGGEVPDSMRVVLADESSFVIRYQRKAR